MEKPSEWVEWGGGVRPVKKGTRVSIKFRLASGEQQNRVDQFDCPECLYWGHHGDGADIIAYRIEE
jgi:hypothetical protein